MYAPGFGTEYTENYCWDQDKATASSRDRKSGDQNVSWKQPDPLLVARQAAEAAAAAAAAGQQGASQQSAETRDPAEFQSTKYPSIYRETIIRKDDRGKYIDPFNNIANKPYGRRLMYDDTHPDKIYPSQWSSELADQPGTYSFPTTTELDPEIPWTKDMQWKAEGEVGRWPTEQWKEWTDIASCPTYDGHDDQVQYHQYKVQIP